LFVFFLLYNWGSYGSWVSFWSLHKWFVFGLSPDWND
jgi:hypothetical protein